MTEEGGEDRIAGLRQLWSELKRRRVVRTSLWYGGACGALIQGADLFVDYLGLPAATVRMLAVLALAGFPLVVVASWAYDISSGDAGPSSRAGRYARGAALAGVAVLSAGAALFLLRAVDPGAGSGQDVAAPPARVAVLPLAAPDSDPELVRFAGDLHARLIDGLSASGVAAGSSENRLRVISRAGILPFGGGAVTTDSIRRALDVGTLIEGEVERDASSARVRLRLTDAASGDVLGVHVARAAPSDLLALTDSVGQALEELRLELGASISARQRLLETGSRDAYLTFMAAQATRADFEAAFRAGSVDRAHALLDEADSLYARAARLDPAWAEPVVARGALVYDRTLLGSMSGADPLPHVRGALQLASDALERDGAHPSALALRGAMRSELARRSPDETEELLRQAEADLRLAARTSPRPASAHRRLSELLARQGRLEEALLSGDRAYQEDPYLDDTAITLLRLFEYSLALGRDDEAAGWCAEGGRRFALPYFQDCALVLMAWSDAALADPDSAEALVERELGAYPGPLRPRLEPRLQALLAATWARAGRPDTARALLARARAGGDRSWGVLGTTAGVLSLLGDTTAAVALVDSVLQAMPPRERPDLERAPELRGLQGHPGLAALREGGTP